MSIEDLGGVVLFLLFVTVAPSALIYAAVRHEDALKAAAKACADQQGVLMVEVIGGETHCVPRDALP